MYLLPAQPLQSNADWWARALAFFGILFAVWKMVSDRRLSILDDFWLRKIISPAAIEPLIETISELLAAVPDSASKVKEHREFAKKMTQDIQRLSGGMQTLAMIDPALPEQMLGELSECEDLFADYLQALSEKKGPDVAELHSAVWLSINNALKPVQQWQSSALFKIARGPVKRD